MSMYCIYRYPKHTHTPHTILWVYCYVLNTRSRATVRIFFEEFMYNIYFVNYSSSLDVDPHERRKKKPIFEYTHCHRFDLIWCWMRNLKYNMNHHTHTYTRIHFVSDWDCKILLSFSLICLCLIHNENEKYNFIENKKWRITWSSIIYKIIK